MKKAIALMMALLMLLPLFCAAYVFLDDEPDKAAFYLARFREGLAAIAPPKESHAAFRDILAWG